MKIDYPKIDELEKKVEILTRHREICYTEKRKLDLQLANIEREILTCSQIIRFHNKEDL